MSLLIKELASNNRRISEIRGELPLAYKDRNRNLEQDILDLEAVLEDLPAAVNARQQRIDKQKEKLAELDLHLPNLDQEAKPKYKSSRAKGYQAQQTQYTRRNPGHLPNDLERPSSSGNVGENGNGLQQLVGTLVFVLLQSVPRLRVFRRVPKNKEKEEQKPKEEK